MSRRILRIVLIVLDGFLALTAIAGGIGLLTGMNAPPVKLLKFFPDYTIPGLALLVIVGGSAAVATYLLVRRRPPGPLASAAAGAVIAVFEIVEVLAIGSEPGVARTLQVFYFSLGLVIVALALTQGALDRGATGV